MPNITGVHTYMHMHTQAHIHTCTHIQYAHAYAYIPTHICIIMYHCGLGVYFSGDGALRDEEGHYQITGRVDDVINTKGHRLGTAELESIMVGHKLP